ncbi:Protein of unknown function [Pyronema omphalodes CBS 100304]|uniref:Uncharacterized protein n=1 Tax=Pyronema omphalodes (strain CBS 100304) TaxID=1076935 RepID=U4KVC2_PYROM|nr:Protein of unknown function [Pyronema omphalodes CBS 100304]
MACEESCLETVNISSIVKSDTQAILRSARDK